MQTCTVAARRAPIDGSCMHLRAYPTSYRTKHVDHAAQTEAGRPADSIVRAAERQRQQPPQARSSSTRRYIFVSCVGGLRVPLLFVQGSNSEVRELEIQGQLELNSVKQLPRPPSVRQNASVIMEAVNKPRNIQYKGVADLVTYTDKLSESAIFEVVIKNFKDHLILGEEGGLIGDFQLEYLWCIDPLGNIKYMPCYSSILFSSPFLTQLSQNEQIKEFERYTWAHSEE
ncbi:hypothetical protein PVAP13_5KG505007 [Panicum virgatum]|uniref:Uncharacterized protein n=1 Tax=Panicum virgatum TaxID=38727 RepID=A0A8T0SM15_PANVG|nr:hypothetical protein PVAP13_5KG505007 [Panicum virgatum]